MEAYVKKLLEQIRCKKARELVEQEIRSHIEDQIAENKACGMTESEAASEAVRDMGDPVEAGIALDAVHKPQIPWGMIGIMAVISVLGIVLRTVIGWQTQSMAGSSTKEYALYAIANIVQTGIAFAVMLLVCRLDYSFIGKYAKVIAAVFYGYMFLQVFFLASPVNGTASWIYLAIPGRTVGIYMAYVLLLAVPLYGAILYQYRGMGYKGIVKSLLWMMVPVLILLRMPCLGQASLLLGAMSVLLSIAVMKNWFAVSKKRFLIGYWSTVILIPCAFVWLKIKAGMFLPYQIARMKSWLSREVLVYAYEGQGLRDAVMGGSFPVKDMVVAVVIAVLLTAAVVKVFRISTRQKNQLGMMMGYGCGIVFLTEAILNIAIVLRLLPPTQTFLPFFSLGYNGIMVCYVLMGIVLSIYRYKNILPEHIDTRQVLLRKTTKKGMI